MRNAEQFVYHLCRAGIGLSFLVLILSVLTQVLARTLDASPVWTEELTRYAMLYMVAFGAGLALRSGDLVNVDVVCEALRGAWPRRLRLVSAVATAVLCAFLLPSAWKYVSIGKMQTSPAMTIRMDYVHFSVMALLAVLGLFAIFRILRIVVLGEDGRPDGLSEDLA